MRDSLIQLIETCFDVKCHFMVGSYVLNHYDDGSYADIKVGSVTNPKELNKLIGELEYSILCIDENLIVRIYEDFREY